MLYRNNGAFDQLRVFGEDRKPQFDIDYGLHQGKVYLHVHFYHDGKRTEGKDVIALKSGDLLYEKYKRLFKGVK